MIPTIRTHSQQLAQPNFDSPKDLVTWMGAIQAQEYNMVRWALATRLPSASKQSIDQALERGEILRTHVMRPTWHLVPAEDIRWMLQLSYKRIKSTNKSYSVKYGITEGHFTRCNKLFENILEGNKSLTREELATEMDKLGFAHDGSYVNRFLFNAETEGIICSGVDKGGKVTYALLHERAPSSKELHKDEALATLATRYFQSHSPATLDDFVWWSGLSLTEARHAIHLIQENLVTDRFEDKKHIIHQSYAGEIKNGSDILHLLPSYDEYLISYKVRTDVLALEHHPKAFNNYGIFQPVILYNGKIVGSWKKVTKKKNTEVNTFFFDPSFEPPKQLLEDAIEKYRTYLK